MNIRILANMKIDESSDDSEDERKLKITIKQEIEDSLQLSSKSKLKWENAFNHSDRNSHHYDRNITNQIKFLRKELWN